MRVLKKLQCSYKAGRNIQILTPRVKYNMTISSPEAQYGPRLKPDGYIICDGGQIVKIPPHKGKIVFILPSILSNS